MNETLDSRVQWEVLPFEGSSFRTRMRIGDITAIFFAEEDPKGTWDIAFSTRVGDGDASLDKTATGHASEILSFVKKSIEKMLKVRRVRVVTFAAAKADGPARMRIYQRMMKAALVGFTEVEETDDDADDKFFRWEKKMNESVTFKKFLEQEERSLLMHTVNILIGQHRAVFFSGQATVNARPDSTTSGELQGPLKIGSKKPDTIVGTVYSGGRYSNIEFRLSTFDDDYTVVKAKSGHTYLTNTEHADGLLA